MDSRVRDHPSENALTINSNRDCWRPAKEKRKKNQLIMNTIELMRRRSNSHRKHFIESTKYSSILGVVLTIIFFLSRKQINFLIEKKCFCRSWRSEFQLSLSPLPMTLSDTDFTIIYEWHQLWCVNVRRRKKINWKTFQWILYWPRRATHVILM